MDEPSWALAAATRQVTILEVMARVSESPDFDVYDVAGVIADFLERDEIDPAAVIVNYLEMKAVLDAVLDDDDCAAARDAVRDIARELADAARSAAHLNQRETKNTQN